MFRFYISLIVSILTLFHSSGTFSQCTWTEIDFDSFEYNTTIPDLIPGTTYQDTPQTFAGCVRTGSRGLYMNIVDGYLGQLYSRVYSDLCVGQEYRFSFWTRDAWTSTNNLTFNIYDGNNILLNSVNVINNSVWQNIITPSFNATTTAIRFEIVTNAIGGPGNDVGFDDLSLQQCAPPIQSETLSICAGSGSIDLFNEIQLPALTQTGFWSGGALSNGYLGTFNPNASGDFQFIYTVNNDPNCFDSVAVISVAVFDVPNIDAVADVESCGDFVLPVISGTNLSGQVAYFTGPLGTGTSYQPGNVISSSQFLYIYDGTTGCFSEVSFNVVVEQATGVSQDVVLSYCIAGNVIDLTNYLPNGTNPNGSWIETTLNPSGTFDEVSGSWNSSGVQPGDYTFEYSIPSAGICSSESVNFSIGLGDMPELNLGNDTTICQGNQLVIGTSQSYDNYLWNTGALTPAITVSNSGTYTLFVSKLGESVVLNGDFSQGNTMFESDYVVGVGGPWGQLSNPGTYAVTPNSNLVHNNFPSCFDHTVGNNTGSMLVVNGSAVPNAVVWGQGVTVTPNTDYQFTVWATSVVSNNPGILRFSINGVQVGAQLNLSNMTCNWQQFFVTWNSGANTTANIAIINQNTLDAGNDFALDDITFRPVCTTTEQIEVTVEPLPVVDLGLDRNLCQGEAVNLDATNSNATYLWNTGSIESNIDTDTAGTYHVTVTSLNGCVASGNVSVNVEELPDAGVDKVFDFCNSLANIDLVDYLDFDTDSDGTWESIDNSLNNQLSSSGTLNIIGISGTHDIIYVSSGTYCPNDTSNWEITIFEQPEAGNPGSFHLCNTEEYEVSIITQLNIQVTSTNGYWIIDPNISTAIDLQNELLNPQDVQGGNYQLLFVLEGEGACVNDTAQIDIWISEMPIIQFSSDTIRGCEDLPVVFINESISSPNTTYNWLISDGTQNTSPTFFQHLFTSAGCYDVTLSATSDGLCVATEIQSQMICVDPLPEAIFTYSPQQVYADLPEVQFNNNSYLNYFNSWDFGDGQSSTVANPLHTYETGVAGEYLVELIVTTDAGCSDTAYQVVIVNEQVIFYVPNAFTPDGDKFNQVFEPVMTTGFDPNDYELRIFNRWGELVFVSQNHSTGWDGTYGGQIAPEGTYIWTLVFGHEYRDERFSYKGHVTLLR